MYVGHRGSDKGGRTLNSGYQIEQINKFSITSLFWKLLDGVRPRPRSPGCWAPRAVGLCWQQGGGHGEQGGTNTAVRAEADLQPEPTLPPTHPPTRLDALPLPAPARPSTSSATRGWARPAPAPCSRRSSRRRRPRRPSWRARMLVWQTSRRQRGGGDACAADAPSLAPVPLYRSCLTRYLSACTLLLCSALLPLTPARSQSHCKTAFL